MGKLASLTSLVVLFLLTLTLGCIVVPWDDYWGPRHPRWEQAPDHHHHQWRGMH